MANFHGRFFFRLHIEWPIFMAAFFFACTYDTKYIPGTWYVLVSVHVIFCRRNYFTLFVVYVSPRTILLSVRPSIQEKHRTVSEEGQAGWGGEGVVCSRAGGAVKRNSSTINRNETVAPNGAREKRGQPEKESWQRQAGLARLGMCGVWFHAVVGLGSIAIFPLFFGRVSFFLFQEAFTFFERAFSFFYTSIVFFFVFSSLRADSNYVLERCTYVIGTFRRPPPVLINSSYTLQHNSR